MPETLQLRKIRLRNWKSFKDCTIELNEGLNVLVGPNASGKTNLLEAFKFLKKALGGFEAPYVPHLEWWTYRNIVFGNDETKPITFELEFECPNGHTAVYEVVFTYVGGLVKPVKESILLPGILSFTREGSDIKVEHDRDLINQHVTEFSSPLLEKIQKTQTISLRSDIITILKSESSLVKGHIVKEHAVDGLLSIKEKDMVTLLVDALILFSPVVESTSLFRYVLRGISNFFNQILFIRHLDTGLIRQPAIFTPDTVVSERGENLTSVLTNWMFQGGGRLPERIDFALKNLFPHLLLNISTTKDGRVYLSVKDNLYNADINPPSLPDGFYKMLHIMSAIESKPSILLVDELENSLHAEIIEYIVEELKDSNVLSIVATHSPVVVDVAGLEHLLLVERTAEGGEVKRVENLEDMKKWMREKGLTPSEMWLYGT